MRLRRLQAPVKLRLTYQRVSLRMRDRFDREIDIEARPIQVMRSWQLDPRDFSYGGVLEPWELPEGYEELLLADEQPESMR